MHSSFCRHLKYPVVHHSRRHNSSYCVQRLRNCYYLLCVIWCRSNTGSLRVTMLCILHPCVCRFNWSLSEVDVLRSAGRDIPPCWCIVKFCIPGFCALHLLSRLDGTCLLPLESKSKGILIMAIAESFGLYFSGCQTLNTGSAVW